MPRNYVRKSVDLKPTEESLRSAVTDVLSKRYTIRKPAEIYNLKNQLCLFTNHSILTRVS